MEDGGAIEEGTCNDERDKKLPLRLGWREDLKIPSVSVLPRITLVSRERIEE
jgi:hypothetical protein